MQFSGKDVGQIHYSWQDFIKNQEFRLQEIEDEIAKSNYTPLAEKVFRFLHVDLQQVKIVILGQDPYPQAGVATGRAFEVGTLKSWNEKFKNVSLKNIVRAIYKAETKEIVKYNDLVNNKLGQSFHVLSPSKLFSYWEEQGVLLLNTSFTCEIGKPGSHATIWHQFTENLLQFISKENEQIIWFLWGDHAMKAVANIPLEKENVISSFHPMMCYERENDFLYTSPNCFEKTWEIIDWTGYRDKKTTELKQQYLF